MENIDLVFDDIKNPIKTSSEYIGITNIDDNFTNDYSSYDPLLQDK